MKRDDLVAGVEFVRAALEGLDAECADRDMTEDEQARWDEGVAYVREAKSTIEKIDQRDAERAEIAEAIAEGRAKPAPESFNVNTRTGSDLFDLSDRSLPASEIRARALEAIEKHVPEFMPDSVREGATRTAERQSTKHYDAELVNRSIIETTSKEYLEAFEQYARFPQGGMPGAHQFRASMSLTAANGGYLVPQYLDPTIILTNSGTMNDVRAISRNIQITVDQWDGVASAGVTGAWLGEGSETTDNSPTFSAPTVTPQKASAYLEGTVEFIADSGFDEVGMLIADAFDRLEASAFITGHNGNNSPYGLITRLSGSGPVVAGSSGDAGAADLVAADIYALVNNLGARWRRNAQWLASQTVYNDIRQLGTADTYHAFWADLGPDVPAQLLGRNVRYAEEMDTTIVSGSDDYVLLLGDFSEYAVVDRVGTSITYIPVVMGSNQRPVGKSGWWAMKRVGADVLTSNAFKLLKL